MLGKQYWPNGTKASERGIDIVSGGIAPATDKSCCCWGAVLGLTAVAAAATALPMLLLSLLRLLPLHALLLLRLLPGGFLAPLPLLLLRVATIYMVPGGATP